jgi:hypothetical protein
VAGKVVDWDDGEVLVSQFGSRSWCGGEKVLEVRWDSAAAVHGEHV